MEYKAPIWSWAKTVAPTGLLFYTGKNIPEWQGDLIVTGLSAGNFWRLNFEDNQIVSVEELFIEERYRSRKIAQSPDGTIYMLTDTLFTSGPDGGLDFSGRPDGQLLRIERAQ